jgi:large subunit ribosomal protein L21
MPRQGFARPAAGAAVRGLRLEGDTGVYAIVQCGGHQVKMVPGETVVIDHVGGDAGTEISFDQVLVVERDGGELVAGAPFVAGARVVAVVEGEARGPKIRVFKKKRRKGMRRTKGHRSTYTRVTVKEIV